MKVIGSSDLFYDNVPVFTDFAEFTNLKYFVCVPEEWFVIVSDVVSSTSAIEEGRYKDVNMIGAASISVVQDALQCEIPFVFGGDGATLLVPPQLEDRAMNALGGLKHLAAEKFDIELRVGRILVRELYEAGADIKVAKHELASGKCIAVFHGGGLNEAEIRIKNDPDVYCLVDQDTASDAFELKGLS